MRRRTSDQENEEDEEDQTPIEALLKLASSGTSSLPLTKEENRGEVEPKQTQHQQTSSFTFSSLGTHLHRQLVLTFIASYRHQLLYILLYVLNYLLVSSIFSSSSAAVAGCVSLNSNSNSACELSFDDEIAFKENAFSLCYTVLYVGLLTIYRSTALFTDHVHCFRAEFRNGTKRRTTRVCLFVYIPFFNKHFLLFLGWYSLSTFYTSTALVALLEAILFAGIISPLAYFVTGQHSADGYAFNWARFATFSAFLLLLILYAQSLGHLVGVAFLSRGNLAALFAIVAYLGVSMLNGFFVNTELNFENNNFLGDPVHTATNLVALKFISRGLVYAIYGIDRCFEEDEEESVVLQFLSVDQDTVWSDCLWVLSAILVLRVTTVALIYAQFASGGQLLKHIFGTPKIDWTLTSAAAENKGEVNVTFQKETSLEMEPSSPKQIPSSPSSADILIAWRRLTLFASPPSLLERVRVVSAVYFTLCSTSQTLPLLCSYHQLRNLKATPPFSAASMATFGEAR